jgi:cytochrome c oxidase subunit II
VRRGPFLQLTLYAVGAAIITTLVAVLIPWMPEDASKEGGRIDFTYWFMTVIAIVVFAVVAAVLIYAVVNFRQKDPDDWSDGPPVHGHTGLEIAWTAVPFVLVTAVAIVSAIVLHQNAQAGSDPLRVTAIGQQFAWQFKYRNGAVEPLLRMPIHRGMILTLTSRDVLHSFWVPQFRQKQDAVPGLPTEIVITPTKLGTFPVICVELCGLGHSTMRSEAIVMTQAAYNAWYKKSASPVTVATTGAKAIAAGLILFKNNGCAACHTEAAAKATGKVGPDLDRLKQEAAKDGRPLAQFISESITDPNAYIAPGYAKGVMPETFKQSLSSAQLDQLVQFLAANAK